MRMRNTCVTYIVALAGMLILQPSPVQAAKADEPVFTASEIAEGDEVYNRINGKSYQENENISLEICVICKYLIMTSITKYRLGN